MEREREAGEAVGNARGHDDHDDDDRSKTSSLECHANAAAIAIQSTDSLRTTRRQAPFSFHTLPPTYPHTHTCTQTHIHPHGEIPAVKMIGSRSCVVMMLMMI